MHKSQHSGYSSQDSHDLDVEKKDMLGQIEKIQKRDSMKKDRHSSVMVEGGAGGLKSAKTLKYRDNDDTGLTKSKMKAS